MRSSTTTLGAACAVVAMAAGVAMAQTTAPQRRATDDGGPQVRATGCLEQVRADAGATAAPAAQAPASASPAAGSSSRSASGAAANRGAAAREGYVLTGARIGGAAVNTSGAAGEPASSDAPPAAGPQTSESSPRLRIVGLRDSELRPHLNQQVEVTGRLQLRGMDTLGPGGVGRPENTRTTGTPGTTGTTGSGTPTEPSAARPTGDVSQALPAATDSGPALIASSVRLIAGTCAGAKH